MATFLFYILLGTSALFTIATAVTTQCKTSHCTNGGTCYIDKTNKASCLCLAGFTGPTCAQIDLCAGNPCSNGGTCVSVVGALSHHCICLPGFSDQNCSTILYPCATKPCHEGTCINNGTNYTCSCSTGYTGVNCETYGGLCLDAPCTSLDSKAHCSNKENAYQCQCSSDDYFGLNCETPSKNCHDEEESYCVCIVDNLPVRFPIPTPRDYDDGIDTRDIISAIIGILLGWLVGTILLHLCFCCFGDKKDVLRSQPWDRPSSAQSNTTVSSGISSFTNDSMPPVGSNKVAPADTQMTPITKNYMPTNVYRAAFVDDLTHTISTRKHTMTYTSGQQDW